MVALAATSGLPAGCTRSALPPASIPRPLGGGLPASPGVAPHPRPAVPPHQHRFDQPDLSRFSSDPWKPRVAAREWTSIVLHHTATDGGSVETIHETHLKRKWLGIGYHFVIGNGHGMPDGQIEATFRWQEQLHGAHAGEEEHNQHGIGIVLVGNFEEHPPTAAQLEAVKRLVGTLKSEYAIPSGRVIGHNDLKATACPGRYFPIHDVSHVASQSPSGGHAMQRETLRLAGHPGSRTP